MFAVWNMGPEKYSYGLKGGPSRKGYVNAGWTQKNEAVGFLDFNAISVIQ